MVKDVYHGFFSHNGWVKVVGKGNSFVEVKCFDGHPVELSLGNVVSEQERSDWFGAHDGVIVSFDVVSTNTVKFF